MIQIRRKENTTWNSGDSCRQCQRAVGNYEILGYGVLIP